MKEPKEFLNKLLNNKDVVVVAISGGPDSMALLHVLKCFQKSKNLQIICAHVNHNLRKESATEATFVKKYCEENHLIFEYLFIEEYNNTHFTEAEGRQKRYDFFESLVKKYQAQFLMTAHHGDDLMETILMHMVRGSNLKGYIGIPRVLPKNNYSLVRPFLTIEKQDIYNYLSENKLDYVLDASNEDEKYTRNRYRKQMLPFLKSEDKRVHQKFFKYSTELEKINQYIEQIVREKLPNIYQNNTILLTELFKEDPFIQEQIMQKVIEIIQSKHVFYIDDSNFIRIMNLINGNNNGKVSLNSGFIFRKSYDKLYIELACPEKQYLKYHYVFDKKISILQKYNIEKISESLEKSNFVIRLNSEELQLPLIIRTKEDGDRMHVKNLFGSKKVKDIFIDVKMDIEKRKEYPIVTDSNNKIIWIPGIKKSIFDKEINEKYDIILKYTEEKNEC